MHAARSLLLCALLAASAPAALARDLVLCHVTYGGATQILRATPVASPYTVPTVAIGSYFLIRIVLQTQPADTASAKIYTYADLDDAPVLIHQSTHAWPARRGKRGDGFTGLQRVYEPMRDGELEYWCEARR